MEDTMSDVPIQLIVAAFKDPNGASQALQALKQAKKEHWIAIKDAAVLTKDAQGKLHIKETKDMGGGKGAVIGGVIGGALGVLAGPIGWAALGGAAIGGLAAKLSDGGFNDARLKKLGEGLTPNSSAIVAVIEHTWVAEVERAMAEAGADVVTESLSADIAAQLSEGGQVAYSLTETNEGLEATRVAASDKKIEASELVATSAGVAAVSVSATLAPVEAKPTEEKKSAEEAQPSEEAKS
jgi:uncharacterized membrane protein